MKTLPNQTASDSALDKRHSNPRSEFSGTDNPRHLRAIHALLTRPMPREHLDRHVGCSNSPDLIAELRRRGLDVPCELVADTDRDGKPAKRGVYHFIEQDHRKINRWLASRQKGSVDPILAILILFAGLYTALLTGAL